MHISRLDQGIRDIFNHAGQPMHFNGIIPLINAALFYVEIPQAHTAMLDCSVKLSPV